MYLYGDKMKKIKLYKIFMCAIGSLILAFGIYNVHEVANITEGGILGATLLFDNWFGISPAISGLIMNTICYLVGTKYFGKDFVIYSLVSGISFSFFYAIIEQFPILWPSLENTPLLASVLGAIFVGIGAGLSVKAGAASGGDDALAMVISHKFKMDIKWPYLVSDLMVLLLSLTYIPFNKIIYSIFTVVLSGQIISIIQKIKR